MRAWSRWCAPSAARAEHGGVVGVRGDVEIALDGRRRPGGRAGGRAGTSSGSGRRGGTGAVRVVSHALIVRPRGVLGAVADPDIRVNSRTPEALAKNGEVSTTASPASDRPALGCGDGVRAGVRRWTAVGPGAAHPDPRHGVHAGDLVAFVAAYSTAAVLTRRSCSRALRCRSAAAGRRQHARGCAARRRARAAAHRSSPVSTSRRSPGHAPTQRNARPDARCRAADPAPKQRIESHADAASSSVVPVPARVGTERPPGTGGEQRDGLVHGVVELVRLAARAGRPAGPRPARRGRRAAAARPRGATRR